MAYRFQSSARNILVVQGNEAGALLRFVTFNSLVPEINLPQGTVIERFTVTDGSNPADPITVTSPDGTIVYSTLDCSGGCGIDLVDLFLSAPTTFRFNNLTPSSVGSIRFYKHRNLVVI